MPRENRARTDASRLHSTPGKSARIRSGVKRRVVCSGSLSDPAGGLARAGGTERLTLGVRARTPRLSGREPAPTAPRPTPPAVPRDPQPEACHAGADHRGYRQKC